MTAPQSERRNPRRRSNHAFVRGPAPNFNPAPAEWSEIEPYKRPFNDDERQRLCAIVNEYLDWRRFASAAAFMDDILAEIDAVRQPTLKLTRALNRLNAYSGPKEAARLDALLAIHREWPGGDGQQRFHALSMLSHALALACKKARSAANKDRETKNHGLKIGAAWDEMVVKLASFAKDCGVKVSSSKGQRSETEIKLSPFVAFVKAIESHYPKGIPTRSSTDHGLSSAIHAVLAASKKRGN